MTIQTPTVLSSVRRTPHPLKGQALSGAQVVIQVLCDEHCTVLFGYSGGAILPVYDALLRHNTRHSGQAHQLPMSLVVGANEQGAGFMASGYARASGQVGVVVVTSGPGATNMVTPVRDAMADSIPMVVLCGQVPTHALGSDAFQEAAVSNIMGSCCKHVFLVTDASLLEATIRTAFELARSGRPGPVVVDIPKDIQNQTLCFDGRSHLPIPGYRKRLHIVENAHLNDAACAHFFSALTAAKRPLVYAGGGVIAANASAALRQFSDRFALPVTTTLMGLGAIDTTSPQALHMLGMHGSAYANYAVEDCDFILVLGARLDDRVVTCKQSFAPNAQFIAQIDIDPAEINKVKPVNWQHVGPLSKALQKLTEYGIAHAVCAAPSAWHQHITELKLKHAMNYDRSSALIQPQAVIEAINRHTKGHAIISTGVGQHQMWAAQYFDFKRPRQWLSSGSMGTMGFGLPAAIGAQLARPDALIIDIDGDSSIRMNLGDLETVTSYSLPIKIVVLNNCGDGMVRQWQKLYFNSGFIASDRSLCRKDFIKAADADGFTWARRLDDKRLLDETITEFLDVAGPAFLEVRIDPDANVYPMVQPGAPYSQMITGPYIATRAPPSTGIREPAPTAMF